MRYLPHTQNDIDSMLASMGKYDLSALFASIPQNVQLHRSLAIAQGISELELKNDLLERAPPPPRMSFLGAGATAHFVPEIVSQLLLRSEWYTAYTPYQPEVSQGTLQAIFEFQTMSASLLGTDIANASMYDGATAFAEGLLMALRLKPGTKHVLISQAVHPEYRQTAATYLHTAGYQILEYGFTQTGLSDIQEAGTLIEKHAGDIAALAYQTPNFLGTIEKQNELITLAQSAGILTVAANTDPVAFGALRSPGEAGADIVVSEGLGLCGHLHLGAPGVGLFGCRQQNLRQMPGRLCGMTTDKEGKRGFVLTLSTREQHIRREKATSNICTNHGLMALAFSISLSLYGQKGFSELAQRNIDTSNYLRQEAQTKGLPIAFSAPSFNENVLRFDSESILQKRLDDLAAQDIYAGVPLSRFYPELSGHLLVSTTELHSQTQIDTLLQGLRP